jgi:hypothetical protein
MADNAVGEATEDAGVTGVRPAPTLTLIQPMLSMRNQKLWWNPKLLNPLPQAKCVGYVLNLSSTTRSQTVVIELAMSVPYDLELCTKKQIALSAR